MNLIWCFIRYYNTGHYIYNSTLNSYHSFKPPAPPRAIDPTFSTLCGLGRGRTAHCRICYYRYAAPEKDTGQWKNWGIVESGEF